MGSLMVGTTELRDLPTRVLRTLLLVGAFSVGCGSAATKVPASQIPTPASVSALVTKSPDQLLLTATELPAGFVLRASPALPLQPGSLIREFERDVPRGPAYVQLFIFLHDDVAAARAKFEASSRDPFSAGSVPPPKAIGDEAYVVRLDMPAYPGGLPYESTHRSVMFRYANVVQSVSVAGARDTVTIGDLMEIAERQLAKIRVP